jgi:hypothetical protein
MTTGKVIQTKMLDKLGKRIIAESIALHLSTMAMKMRI